MKFLPTLKRSKYIKEFGGREEVLLSHDDPANFKIIGSTKKAPS